MDQCEDREEGVPPSETTLCGEHESKAKRFKPGFEAKATDVFAKSERSEKDNTGFKFNVPTSKARNSDPEGNSNARRPGALQQKRT
ncbi:hypothetical protein ILYODFUR_033446 [Ilyodon furcidens]|uniref:Uncharacterized protein n=1 Tax=Ilyodon furcidens TaxID=33524 RepID=A0ABV0TRW2_9TELE